jgi:hypothetical protein
LEPGGPAIILICKGIAMSGPRIRQLGPTDDLPRVDHVLVVKLAPNCFEVSGTAGAGPTANYLPATPFANQVDALASAEDFAREHKLKCVYVKGFRPKARAPLESG